MAWIYLDKPEGLRSVQCLNLIKKKIKVKCGIWGILDEFACGLLPIATQKDTKNIDKNNGVCKKQYIFTVQWGTCTDTGDHTGTITEQSSVVPSLESIENILSHFIGSIEQIPPIFSNIKINGVRAHQLARQGATIELKPRTVEIFSLEIMDHSPTNTTFKVWVGSGTYIRSLAMDMAYKLGTQGHLIYLRREAVDDGEKIIYPSITLEELLSYDDNGINMILSN